MITENEMLELEVKLLNTHDESEYIFLCDKIMERYKREILELQQLLRIKNSTVPF